MMMPEGEITCSSRLSCFKFRYEAWVIRICDRRQSLYLPLLLENRADDSAACVKRGQGLRFFEYIIQLGKGWIFDVGKFRLNFARGDLEGLANDDGGLRGLAPHEG